MNAKNCCQCSTGIGQNDSEYKKKVNVKYNVFICLGTTCYLRGSIDILKSIKDELGIEPGETTTDNMFALELVRCLGACAVGPVMMINDVLYPNVSPDSVAEIFKAYK